MYYLNLKKGTQVIKALLAISFLLGTGTALADHTITSTIHYSNISEAGVNGNLNYANACSSDGHAGGHHCDSRPVTYPSGYSFSQTSTDSNDNYPGLQFGGDLRYVNSVQLDSSCQSFFTEHSGGGGIYEGSIVGQNNVNFSATVKGIQEDSAGHTTVLFVSNCQYSG